MILPTQQNYVKYSNLAAAAVPNFGYTSIKIIVSWKENEVAYVLPIAVLLFLAHAGGVNHAMPMQFPNLIWQSLKFT